MAVTSSVKELVKSLSSKISKTVAKGQKVIKCFTMLKNTLNFSNKLLFVHKTLKP